MAKKFLLPVLLLTLGFFLASCDSTTDPEITDAGTVVFKVTPKAAKIFVDGTQVGVADTTLKLKAGMRTVKLTATGYVDTTFTLVVIKDQTVNKEVIMKASLKSIRFESSPVGAAIWLNGSNTGLLTPANVEIGATNSTITYKLDGYKDSTFTVNSSTASPVTVTLKSSLIAFGPTLRMWETSGTTAAQPSGLILKTGRAVSTSNDSVDIYFSSTGFVIASSTSKTTKFKVSNATNLNDAANSDVYSATGWVNSFSQSETNYVFIYTQEKNYAKFKIVSRGGGTIATGPAWVEVQYLYNITSEDPRF